MADVLPEANELVHFVVHLAGCLYAEYVGVDSGMPFVRIYMISALASDTVRPNAANTTTITSIIFLGCSGDHEMASASSG